MNRPRETIEVSRQLDPDHVELRGWFLYWRDLARAYHRLGGHRQELRVARQARELFAGDPQAVELEVVALAALGRHNALRTLLRDQESLYADPTGLVRGVALELRAHGSPAMADSLLRHDLTRQLASPPRDRAAHFQLARTHDLLGENDEAERLLRALPSEGPAIAVQAAIGVLAARRGDTTAANRISRRLAALEVPYSLGYVTYLRARIAAVSGDADGAIELLRQAIREGRNAWETMHTDPDLDAVRNHAAYRELVRPAG